MTLHAACLIKYAGAQVGACTPTLGEAYLDVNNVRARIFNNGNLFWRGSPHVYEVPKDGGTQAIFTSGIWIGGYTGGELRVAAARYHSYHFWAGPLDEMGHPPPDCSKFDRLYKISLADIQEYEASGVTTKDLRDWPTGLGAPTYAPPDNGADDDKDGEIDEDGEQVLLLDLPLAERADRVIDLRRGERPAILGQQSIWWIMNDRGNEHLGAASLPIGLEVHVLAFAFNTGGDIDNATFYVYDFFYKGQESFTDVHLAIFSDVDLGNFQDDWTASDTTLNMGMVWNADNNDEGDDGYGSPAPAVGYDLFQGPIVPSPGDIANVGGSSVPDFRNLEMTSFTAFYGGGGNSGDPTTALHHYNYMRGRWKDGRCVTEGGYGRIFSETCTRYMFAGDMGYNDDMCQYWSECNSDGLGMDIAPADRRIVMGTGPFTMEPGDSQQIIFGIVWARGTDNYDSAQKVKEAGKLTQAWYNTSFLLPSPPDAPHVTATPMDGQVILEWSNGVMSNNFLESYRMENPLVPPNHNEYLFEGYEVIQYENALDQIGQTIMVYDVPNGVQRVIDAPPSGLRRVTATGTDRGVQTYHVIPGLTNYRTYHFGVQAYAFNDASVPKVLRGPARRIEVIPARSTSVLSEAALAAFKSHATPDFEFNNAGIGDGRVWANVVNPGVLQDATYSVEFYVLEDAERTRVVEEGRVIDPRVAPPRSKRDRSITYDIKRDGTVIFDGAAAGWPAPQRPNVMLLDGLQFSIVSPINGFSDFLITANATGPLDPPESAKFDGLGFPDPQELGSGTIGRQQHTANTRWGINAGGATSGTYGPILLGTSFTGRVLRGGDNLDALGPRDYEMRFTQRCRDRINGIDEPDDCLGFRPFGQVEPLVMEVPFELWDTGIETPNDPSDDVRLVPAICDTAHCGGGHLDGVFDIGGDHPASSGADDPVSDWVYFYRPEDLTPGEHGYNAYWINGGSLEEIMARIVLILHNGGTMPPYPQNLPEAGTILRIETNKPNQPGDVHTASMVGYGVHAPDPTTARRRLEDIGIVPNPYVGASSYEVNKFAAEVRFTNLPDVAIIRVFTLNGTLIKTIRKQSKGMGTLSWNLTTDHNLPIASGLYLIHVEVPGVGETALKFAVVKKQAHLSVY